MSRAPRPAGAAPPASECVPHRRRVPRVKQELDAVLTRVPGPADHHRGPGDGPLGNVHARRQVTVRQPLDERPGERSLDGDHRELLGAIDDVDVERSGVLLEPAEVLLVVGRIRDGEEHALRDPIGEQVIEHAPVIAAQDAVLGTALGQAAKVVGEHVLEEADGVRAPRLDLAHVRHVEQADPPADTKMLILDAGVLDGHLPPGEGHELGPGRDVAVVQGGAPQSGLSGGT